MGDPGPGSSRPVLIVVAGPNGSGKTSLTSQVLAHRWIHGCAYVNPDNIARDMFGDWNSTSAVLDAAKHAEALRERCLQERRSLAFETVLSAPDKVDFVRRAKEAGFFVRVFFVGTRSPTINAARVAQRVMEGGHDVPISKIVARYSRSLANCVALLSMSDRGYVYDNSVDGADARLLYRTADGRLAKVYGDIEPWAQSVLNALAACGADDVPMRAAPERPGRD